MFCILRVLNQLYNLYTGGHKSFRVHFCLLAWIVQGNIQQWHAIHNYTKFYYIMWNTCIYRTTEKKLKKIWIFIRLLTVTAEIGSSTVSYVFQVVYLEITFDLIKLWNFVTAFWIFWKEFLNLCLTRVF